MPIKPNKPCAKPRCPNLTTEKYCDTHKQQEATRYEKQRGSAAERGYDRRWQKARAWYLKRNPLCVHCQAEGKLTVATVIDHVRPHKGDMVLFWDSENNWQSLCTYHHNLKTATKDGGFGR